MSRHVVATADEIPPGGRKIVEVAGRSIGVFNVGGAFYALRNRCPHQGAALCEGRLWGNLTADVPGDYRYDRQHSTLTCPWHGWEFDIRTGQSWCDPERLRVRSYGVESVPSTDIDGAGDASADVPEAAAAGGAPAAGTGARIRGPYVAETYPVSRVQRYLVVDLS